jgi:porin
MLSRPTAPFFVFSTGWFPAAPSFRALCDADALTALLLMFMLIEVSSGVVLAQGTNFGNPAAPPPPTTFAAAPSPLEDLWGVHRTVDRLGLTISGIYTGEVLANVNGGIRTGAIAEGLLELDLDLDLGKSIGLKGGSFHFAIFDSHGQGLSQRYTGDLSTVSNIDAYNTVRIAEYWYEQEIFNKRFSIRIGQFLTENEFYYSDYSNLFICGSFGAYTFLVNNYPFAPSYPISAPGVRLLLHATPQLDFNVGIYSGSTLSQQTNNRSIPNVRGKDGFLSFYEIDFKTNHEDTATGLPGTYKLGATFHSRYDGALNANPGSINRSGYGFYLTVDQAVWQKQTVNKQAKAPSLGLFTRLGYMPADFGFVSCYVEGGFNYNGLFPGRNDDIFGIGITHSGISGDASRRIERAGGPRYSSETLIEATYSAKLFPWLTMQPDFQYIVNPGATNNTRNAAVLGIRSTLTF